MAESATPRLHPALPWLGAGLAYLGVVLVLTWPLALHAGTWLLGQATTDQADTAWLRLAASRALLDGSLWSTDVFAPAGYPLGAIVPNWVDHLLGAPLALALPFPLGDNLWWVAVLVANGLAGHLLGRRLGGTHGAGFLCGLGFLLSEPILREASQGHAPQALALWGPLYLVALVEGLQRGSRRLLLAAGALLALGGLTYWFHVAFFGLASLPLLVEHGVRQRAWRPAATVGGVAAALMALPLLLTLLGSEGLATASLPASVVHRGEGLLWPLLPGGTATTNRLSLVLLLAAGLGTWKLGRRAWVWWAAVLLGGVLIVAPPLWRLHWPERWGLVVVLALLPLAARAPRAWILAPLLAVEVLLLSVNAPLPVRSLESMEGWRALSASPGPVLVLPLVPEGEEGDPVRSQRALAYRLSGTPLVSELNLPPMAREPGEFDAWRFQEPLIRWAKEQCAGSRVPVPQGAADALVDQGIAAIALDLTPGGAVNPLDARVLARPLEEALGSSVDYGSVAVWWLVSPEEVPPGLEDPDAWRQGVPRPEGARLIPRRCRR